MPACFQLRRKTEKEPIVLARLDDELRAHFKQPPSPSQWLAGWYNYIGFTIAMGKKLGSEELRAAIAEYKTPALDMILSYLEENFSSESWYESK